MASHDTSLFHMLFRAFHRIPRINLAHLYIFGTHTKISLDPIMPVFVEFRSLSKLYQYARSRNSPQIQVFMKIESFLKTYFQRNE